MASIQQFLDYLLYEKKYSSHTVLAYQKDLETFAVFIQNQFEEEELREVNYSMIRSWIISLVDNGISNRSINRKISSLKTFYKFLLKIKEIETSPLVKHKSLKVDKKVQVPFSSKEVSEVIESFQPEGFSEFRDQLIIELLYSTGMRRAELINLKLDSVDVSGKQLKVLGKRNKERIIPLLPTVLKTFQNYLLERSELAIINDEKYLKP